MSQLVDTDPNAASEDVHLQRLLATSVEEPWIKSLVRNIQDTINPPKLPPLEVTSKPVAVKDIWGLYGQDKKSFLMSTTFQVAVVTLLFTVASSKTVQDKVKQAITPLIAPNIEPYTPKVPPKAQTMQGGGGAGKGGGFGPGEGGGVGGGVFRVGGGVTAPSLLSKVEPEYSEEARRAKYQGTVVLYVEVYPDGKAHNLKVLRSLGLGLDE